jgi:hypothetical protein
MHNPAPRFPLEAEIGVSFVASGPPDRMPVERFAPAIRRAFDCWRLNAERRGIPARQDIDPIDLGTALPNVALWDVAGVAYVCRLAGSRICGLAEREVRGLTAEAVMPDPPQVTRAEFDLVRQTKALHYCERPISNSGKYRGYSRLLLPLSSDSESVNVILAVMDLRLA